MGVCKHGCDVSDLQWSTFSVFTESHLNTQRVGRILESYANPRHISGLDNCLELFQPSLCLDEAM